MTVQQVAEPSRQGVEIYRLDPRQQWDSVADGWHDWADAVSDWVAPLTERMLQIAAIHPGNRVLDVAAGDGFQSLRVARRVGSPGYVFSTDIAPRMVTYAAESARLAGLTNMQVGIMDGEQLRVADESFDAVLNRFGLMFFDDPRRALGEAYRVLKPGGRFAAIVFTTPEKSPWLSLAVNIALEHAGYPITEPGLFSLGDQDHVERLLYETGFIYVGSELMQIDLKLASAAEARRFMQAVAGPIHGILAGLDDAQQQAAWEAIESSYRQFETDDGFAAPTELILVGGMK